CLWMKTMLLISMGSMWGYKINASPDPYTFIPVDKSHKSEVQSYELTSLNRFTEYSFIIQAYNKRGAGPI
ncbi:down syndrome cell adhesion molecule-like protein Dscam2, partial [Caerostris extrusa]